jgi:hypothetical protein
MSCKSMEILEGKEKGNTSGRRRGKGEPFWKEERKRGTFLEGDGVCSTAGRTMFKAQGRCNKPCLLAPWPPEGCCATWEDRHRDHWRLPRGASYVSVVIEER